MASVLPTTRMPGVDTAGDQLVATLKQLGIEKLFICPGSEWPPLWEAIAKAGPRAPRLINTRHELLTVAAAIGYQRRTGELPCIALHTTVGLLNASMGLRLALHEHVPLVVLTGEAVTFGERADTRIEPQWLRALADLGGPAQLALPYSKWSCRLEDVSLLSASLRHAAQVALAPPCGPVVLSLPLEVMTQPATNAGPQPRPTVPRFEAPDRELRRVAEALVEARQPVIVSETAGRDPGNVTQLVALAELLGAPVVQSLAPSYLNFPSQHPLHLGYDASACAEGTDLWLLAGSPTPVHPPSKLAGANVVALSEQPEGTLVPVDRQMAGTVLMGPLSDSLRRLTEAVRALGEGRPGWESAAAERRQRWSAAHDRQRAAWRERSAADGEEALIAELARVLPAEAIAIEETTIHRNAVLRHFSRDLPGTFYSRHTGGLGMMLGEALGVKLGAPDEVVAAVVGDGSLHYSPTLACLGMAQEYGLPLLVCVINNAGYASMKRNHELRFPQGYSATHDAFCGVSIEPAPDYCGLAACYGGHGVRVRSVAEVAAAVSDCVARVRAGQTCLIEVVCGQ